MDGFSLLPEEMIVEILAGMTKEERQMMRAISPRVKEIVDNWYGCYTVISPESSINATQFPNNFIQNYYRGLRLDSISWSVPQFPRPILANTRQFSRVEFNGELKLENLKKMLLQSPNLRELLISKPILIDRHEFRGYSLEGSDLPKIAHFEMTIEPHSYGWGLRYDATPEEDERRILALVRHLPFENLRSFRIFWTFSDPPFPDGIDSPLRAWSPMTDPRTLDVKSPKTRPFQVPRLPSLSQTMYLREILLKSPSLRELVLERAFDFDPEPALDGMQLDVLRLNWAGDSGWARRLLENNRQLQGLTLRSPDRPFVQRSLENNSGTLQDLNIGIFTDEDEFDEGDPGLLGDLSPILGCTRLKKFSFFAKNEFHFRKRFGIDGTAPLPQELEELTLTGAFEESIFAQVAALPKLKKFTLCGSQNTRFDDWEFEWANVDDSGSLITGTYKLNWPLIRDFLQTARMEILVLHYIPFDWEEIRKKLATVPGISTDFKGYHELIKPQPPQGKKYAKDFFKNFYYYWVEFKIERLLFDPMQLY